MMGPATNTQKLVQVPEMAAGPKERVGLMEQPSLRGKGGGRERVSALAGGSVLTAADAYSMGHDPPRGSHTGSSTAWPSSTVKPMARGAKPCAAGSARRSCARAVRAAAATPQCV